MSLSLSKTPSVKITYDTPREISDEVLGGVIKLCRETGYKMSTKMLAFLWSSFLYPSKEILEKNGILNDTLNCFTYSLGIVFPKVSKDDEIKEKINNLLMKYWDKLCIDFVGDLAPDD